MDAKEADAILAAQEPVLETFCSRHGLSLKRNDHFEAINRAFQWKDDGLLKVINIEFMYRDDPAFDLQLLVSSMPRRLAGNRQQRARKMCEVRLPMSPHDLEDLLERAKRRLDAIRHIEELTRVDVL
jgi:hypothetical protein